jgi:hypothetical protein
MRTIHFASVCGATLLAVTSFAHAQGTGVVQTPIRASRPSNAGM